MTIETIIYIVIGVLLLLLAGSYWLLRTKRMTVPFLYQYNPGYTIGVVENSNPLDIHIEDINVLEKQQFSIHPQPTIMADPFVVKDKDIYYIFYEELSAKYCHSGGADICVLQSTDGIQWQRIGCALHEPFHLSFPNVFQWKGEWYMLPEAQSSGEMRLYKAKNFPLQWSLCKVLMQGVAYADPMIFEQDGIWYLWFNTYINGDNFVLYTSDSPLGEWTEHPASPIRTNGDDTRPAGRIAKVENRLVYFVQSHREGYGTGTIAYEIDIISPTDYQDHRMVQNPVLWKNGDDWAKDGMHHLSFLRKENGGYLCVTDGLHASLQWKWDWRNLPSFNIRKR